MLTSEVLQKAQALLVEQGWRQLAHNGSPVDPLCPEFSPYLVEAMDAYDAAILIAKEEESA